MKTLVVYYSYSGSAQRLAQKLAMEMEADTLRVLDVKRPGMLAAYTAGCLRAMRQKPSVIQPLETDLAQYDRLVLVAPVWAGMPAPPFNAVVQLIPAGKTVEIHLVSASGKSSAHGKVEPPIETRGSHVTLVRDIQSASI